MATKLSLVNEPCCQKVSMSGTTSQSNSNEEAASILLSPSQKKSEDYIAANIWNISAGFFELLSFSLVIFQYERMGNIFSNTIDYLVLLAYFNLTEKL